MKRSSFAAAFGFGAVIALGLFGLGCSSSNSATGTGGATGTAGATGTGGHINGLGGSTGQGGNTGQGGSAVDAGPAAPLCASPAPADKAACDSNPTCAKGCGVNITAITSEKPLKTCTCSGPASGGGTWSCPGAAGGCVYPTDIDLTCFHLPAAAQLPLCPHDPADGGTDAGGADAGAAGLLRPGVSTCTPPPSEVCGNICGSAATGTPTYQDSNDNPKVGYCVCISGFWQCASTAEWPAQN